MTNAKNAVRGLLAAGVAAATLMFGATAGAQQQEQNNPYLMQVVSQLAQFSERAQQAGFGPPELIAASALAAGASETHNYANSAGREIVVVAVCDNDCNDIDLRIRDGKGNVIGEDVLPDALPIVPVPAGAGPLAVEAAVAHCAQAPCVYAVAVYARQ